MPKHTEEVKIEVGTGEGGTTCVYLSPTMDLPDGRVRVYFGDHLIWFGNPGVDATEVGWELADRYVDGTLGAGL